MNRRKFESRIALAMLPIGALLTLAALFGMFAVVAYAADTIWHRPADAGWRIGWSLAATAGAMFDLRKGIETMATFDWHVAIAPLACSAAIVATCPEWWL